MQADPGEKSVVTLRFETAAVEVCAGARDLAWLREFLGPWFEELERFEQIEGSATPPLAARVELFLDDDAFLRQQEAGPHPGGETQGAFALDGGMLRLPRWRGASPEDRVVFDEPLGVFHRVARDGATIRVHVTSATGNRRARIALLRTVRELVVSEVQAAGRALLHAAAVATPTGGALIAGPKRAGKTTLLVHALRAGAELVSNDRVVLVPGATGFVVRGMPTIVRIRPATLDSLPEALRAPLANGRIDHLASRDEIARGLAPERPRPGRPRNLSPAQLCDWLGARARRDVAPDRILLLRATESPGVAARELPTDAAAEALFACRFGVPGERSELFAASPRSAVADPDAAMRACRELAKSARCHEVELGIGTGSEAAFEALASLFR